LQTDAVLALLDGPSVADAMRRSASGVELARAGSTRTSRSRSRPTRATSFPFVATVRSSGRERTQLLAVAARGLGSFRLPAVRAP
jgi:hypothetical protein